MGVAGEVDVPAGLTVGDPVASGLTCGGQGSPEIAVPAGKGTPVGPDARTGSVAKGARTGDEEGDGVGDEPCVGVGDEVDVAVGVTVSVGDGDGVGVGVTVNVGDAVGDGDGIGVGVAVAVCVGGAAIATVRDNAAVGVRGTVDVTTVDAVRIALADGASSAAEASTVTVIAGVEVTTTVAVSVSVALIAIEPVMGAVDVIASAGPMATAVS